MKKLSEVSIENLKNLKHQKKKFILANIRSKCKNENEKYLKKKNQLRY